MSEETIDLTNLTELRNITIERLIDYGFTAIKGEKITVVDSEPHTIPYGSGVFSGFFCFFRNTLGEIELQPIIPNVEIPNYPSEEYQKIKAEYCISILRSIYGKETAATPTVTYWEKDGITIACCIMLEGRNEYEGGNIIIHIGD